MEAQPLQLQQQDTLSLWMADAIYWLRRFQAEHDMRKQCGCEACIAVDSLVKRKKEMI